MPTVWIIHRQGPQRAALARIAGGSDEIVLVGPEDRMFESAPPPDVAVMAVSGDFEVELEFAHRLGKRLAATTWVILAEADALAEARRAFDTLPAEFLTFPASPSLLRPLIRAAGQHRSAPPLSRRRSRDALARRFARWFGDLEIPQLMRALDPRLARVPLLALGEPGSGRGLLARYVHAYGGAPNDGFVHIACAPLRNLDELLARIAEVEPGGDQATRTLWLEDVDLLAPELQRRVRDWIEYGLPSGAARATAVRWIASATLDAGGRLDEGLAQALSGLQIPIPPLRDRPHCIEAFVAETATEWGAERGERPRSFSPETIQALREYPWPGNLRELEAVVTRSLSANRADPLLPAHLCFDGLDALWSRSTESTAPASEPRLDDTLVLPSPERAPVAETEADLPEAEILPPEDVLPEAEILLEDEVLPELEPEPDIPEIRGVLLDDETPKTDWPRIIQTVAHEIRNPLVSIRTFSELLPDRYEDPEFRKRFSKLVVEDVRRIDDVLRRLGDLAESPEAHPEAVDVAQLLDELLDERREEIQERRLLVLKELDRERPLAAVDPEQLRNALGGLVTRAISSVPDHGDVYVASHHHPFGLQGLPMLRVLIRYNQRGASSVAPLDTAQVMDGLKLEENSIEVALADMVIRAHGGTLTIDSSDPQEMVLLIDIPAPT